MPDQPRPVIRRGWRISGPLAVVAAAVTLVGVGARIVLVRRACPARSG